MRTSRCDQRSARGIVILLELFSTFLRDCWSLAWDHACRRCRGAQYCAEPWGLMARQMLREPRGKDRHDSSASWYYREIT